MSGLASIGDSSEAIGFIVGGHPKYSVLMSVYGGECGRYLGCSIESMLRQSIPPDEIVLICDGPLTVELDTVISFYEDRLGDAFSVIRLESNLGLGEALRVGLPACRNDLVARMDSDDISVPHRMEVCLRYLEANPDVDVVGGQISEFTRCPEESTGKRLVPLSMDGIRKMLYMRNPMNHVTTLLRKEKVLAVGGYEGLRGFEDYYLWARLLASGAVLANVDEVVCNVRVSRDMYKSRRGGFGYFKNAKWLAGYMLGAGLITKMQYCESVFVRFCQCVLVPPSIRELVFKKVLRDS